jgi:hypothetical protein
MKDRILKIALGVLCSVFILYVLVQIYQNTWFFVPEQSIRIEDEMEGFDSNIRDNITNTLNYNKMDMMMPLDGYVKNKTIAIKCSDQVMRYLCDDSLLLVRRKVFHDPDKNLWIVLYRYFPLDNYAYVIINGRNGAVVGISSLLYMEKTNIK